MNRSNKKERGQALILIVFGIVGMIGLTALAIDGGNAYSDRRHAQNAADTSVLAAALARVRQPAGTSPADAWKDAGYARAIDNGYLKAGPNSTVLVSLCSDTGVTCQLPATVNDGYGNQVPTDPSQFVKVTIASTVRTYFAPVIGIRQLDNQVEAIARAVPSVQSHYFNGAALAATMPGCKPSGWSSDPFTVGGGSIVNITGSEIFVNSTCNPDFTTGGSGSLLNTNGICLVGQEDPHNAPGFITGPTPQPNCGPQLDIQQYNYPDVAAQCAALGTGAITGSGGNYTATAGNYYGGAFPDKSPSGTLKLGKGLYCLHSGLTVNAGWVITTDNNGNGTYDYASEGALFYVPTDGVSFAGNSEMHLHAVTVPGCLQSGLNGLLIYLPLGNTNTVKIAGGNDSTYYGTILAPSSLVTLEGGSSSASDHLDMQTQVIGYSVSVGGGGTLNIHYDPCVTSTTYTSPQLQPYK